MAYGLIIQRRLDHMLQSVRDGLEWVSGIKWNRCPESPGMGVRNAPEYAVFQIKVHFGQSQGKKHGERC
jgi:hypothetical protein